VRYYGFRYYNPSTGRWLSRDPIAERGGLNLYGMVGNNPINYFDPYGLDAYRNISDFVAGAGDSLTFGLTRQVRKGLSWFILNEFDDSYVRPESGYYIAGEATEVAIEITVTLGGASLRHAARRASRSALEGGARASFRRVNQLEGGFIHHINPIKGHPGGAAARYPLPFEWAVRGSWNMKWVPTRAAHMAEHARMMRFEALDRLRESTLLIRQAANRIALFVEQEYPCDWSVSISADVSGEVSMGGDGYAPGFNMITGASYSEQGQGYLY